MYSRYRPKEQRPLPGVPGHIVPGHFHPSYFGTQSTVYRTQMG
jgi:hypothetical protein